MKRTATKGGYREPDDFIPKEIRKKHGIGEFAEKKKPAKKSTKKSAK